MANQIYQYSIVSALMDGVASAGVPIARVLEHGDTGLGTFKNMVGEMIVVDSDVYQMKADGSVVHVADTTQTITPFATVTRFEPQQTKTTTVDGKKAFSALLSELFPESKNHFIAIRMDGTFNLKVRTAGGQCFHREKMMAVANRQTTHEFEHLTGTIVGFRCPEFVMGINVAGDHLHFIDAERKRGGHILSFESVGEVKVQAAKGSSFTVDLPTNDDEYDGAELTPDADGIRKIEG